MAKKNRKTLKEVSSKNMDGLDFVYYLYCQFTICVFTEFNR